MQEDGENTVRASAAKAIGLVAAKGDPAPRGALITCLHEEHDRPVRGAAAQAHRRDSPTAVRIFPLLGSRLLFLRGVFRVAAERPFSLSCLVV